MDKVFKSQKSLMGKGSFKIYPGKAAAMRYHNGSLPQKIDSVPSCDSEKGPPTE